MEEAIPYGMTRAAAAERTHFQLRPLPLLSREQSITIARQKIRGPFMGVEVEVLCAIRRFLEG